MQSKGVLIESRKNPKNGILDRPDLTTEATLSTLALALGKKYRQNTLESFLERFDWSKCAFWVAKKRRFDVSRS